MIKILIVEDEKPISDLIKMNLADEGYYCVCAYDGQEAADIVENDTFDLVLLDINTNCFRFAFSRRNRRR